MILSKILQFKSVQSAILENPQSYFSELEPSPLTCFWAMLSLKLLGISVQLQILCSSGQGQEETGHATPATSCTDNKFQILSVNPLALYKKNQNHLMPFFVFFFLSPLLKSFFPGKNHHRLPAKKNICKC